MMSVYTRPTYQPAIKRSLYADLPLEQDDSIRLLKLLPGSGNMPLLGSLVSLSLSEACGHYSALSYTWGNASTHGFITINGQAHDLRQTLYRFLMNIRSSEEELYLWTDAICIDQDNNVEKGIQVQLMGQIYSNAIRTMSWLGEELEDVNALQTLTFLGPKLLENRQFFECCSDSDSQLYCGQFRRAILHLHDKIYWTRVWVLQEIILASKIELCCGQNTLTWELLRCCLNHTYILSTEERAMVNNGNLFDIIRDQDTHHDSVDVGRGLGELIRAYGFSGCTIPRDRVFALLGLISHEADPFFQKRRPERAQSRRHARTVSYNTARRHARIVNYTTAPEIIWLRILTLYQLEDLLKFAMPLFRALELDDPRTMDSLDWDAGLHPHVTAMLHVAHATNTADQITFAFTPHHASGSNINQFYSLSNLTLRAIADTDAIRCIAVELRTRTYSSDDLSDVLGTGAEPHGNIEKCITDILACEIIDDKADARGFGKTYSIRLTAKLMKALCTIDGHLRKTVRIHEPNVAAPPRSSRLSTFSLRGWLFSNISSSETKVKRADDWKKKNRLAYRR